MIPICPPDFWEQVAKRVAASIMDREINLSSSITRADTPKATPEQQSEWIGKQVALQTKAGA